MNFEAGPIVQLVEFMKKQKKIKLQPIKIMSMRQITKTLDVTALANDLRYLRKANILLERELLKQEKQQHKLLLHIK